MSSIMTLIIGLLSLAVICHSMEYAPTDMLIPTTDISGCNLDQEIENKYFLCDPDRLLKRKQAMTVNWLLRDVAKNSSCPCSNHWCETNIIGTSGVDTGYHIGVALVNKMKLEESPITQKTNNPRDQAMLFARHLEKDRWNLGHCQEDIIIFYAHENQELAIHVGKTAAMKLDGPARLRLMQKSRNFFAEGKINEGLYTLITDTKILLNCPFKNLEECELGVIRMKSGAGILAASVTVLFMSILVTIFGLV